MRERLSSRGGATTCSPIGAVVWRAMLGRLWQPARVKLVVASISQPITEWTVWCRNERGFAAAELLAPAMDNWAAHRTSLWTVGCADAPVDHRSPTADALRVDNKETLPTLQLPKPWF